MKYKKRIRKIPRDILCKKISDKCNYVDPGLVGEVYNGLIRMIMDDLRVYGNCYLPEWGEFRITEIGDRESVDVNTMQRIVIPAHKTLRFKPCSSLKYYIKNKF